MEPRENLTHNAVTMKARQQVKERCNNTRGLQATVIIMMYDDNIFYFKENLFFTLKWDQQQKQSGT